MAEIWIEVAENGDVTVEGKSADLGKDCTVLTREIEAALGETTSQKLKPEFHKARPVLRTKGQ